MLIQGSEIRYRIFQLEQSYNHFSDILFSERKICSKHESKDTYSRFPSLCMF